LQAFRDSAHLTSFSPLSHLRKLIHAKFD
jgi:hypothetical protein